MKKRFRGQGLVEFALVLPILLLILLGIVEAALVIQGHLTVQHAAREAARFAVTNQPIQGACMDLDRDGVLEDGINDTQDGGDNDDLVLAKKLDNDDNPDDGYPYCPSEGKSAPDAYLYESDADYYERRVLLIKGQARHSVAGLRIRRDALGLTESADGLGGTFNANMDKPGYLGVRVWGFPSFDSRCNDTDIMNKKWDHIDSEPGCLDHPGLQGLPVRVLVIHNVEVIDPFYRLIAPYVTVQATAEMLNEGAQVGQGNRPPPHWQTSGNPMVPTLGPSPTPGGPDETATPTATPEPTPTTPPNYEITLEAYPEGGDEVSNEMPGDRSHLFLATVSYLGQPMENRWVSFETNAGAFNYAGTGNDYIEVVTNSQGEAMVALYGNGPMTATIRAWIDLDGNDAWNGEPYDTAQKVWYFPDGPYITVSEHDAVALSTLSANVMQHDTAISYTLHWCVISGTNTSTVLIDPVPLDGSGNGENLLFTVPEFSAGMYQLETHPVGGDGCGGSDLVAYSAAIQVVVALPDLTISIIEPELICPRTVFTMTAIVSNATYGTTDEDFDIDFYVDPQGTPISPIGVTKQWVSGIGPLGSLVVNTLMWVDSPGEHTIWARVDTTNYVEEEDEANNTDSMTKATGGITILAADFDSDAGGFSYLDDAFLGTSQPAYASGNRISSGGYSGGALRVRLGNIDDIAISNMSGGWRASFNLSESTETVVSFYYRLTQAANYETDEYSDALVSVDGTLYNVARITGDDNGGSDQTTGWQYFEVDAGTLSAGSHTLTIGGFNNKKTYTDEWTEVLIDSVSVREKVTCDDDDPPPWGIEDWENYKPPGLRECHQLLTYGHFEGDSDKVLSKWSAGPPNAYQRQSLFYFNGTLSMRLHTSLGIYPGCNAIPNPYLYQTVQIPTEVYTQTTLHVKGQRLVAPSVTECCYHDRTDPNDRLYLNMRDGAGTPLTGGDGIEVVSGNVVTGTWKPFSIDVTDVVSPYARGGQDVQVYFHGIQSDTDYDCTFFYLDSLECEMCTYWEYPPDVPGTASFGGLIQVVLQSVPQTRPGVNVWAYSQGGDEVYFTKSIHDGTYGFYNVEPGTYTIYAEYWEGGAGGSLHYGTWTVTVTGDERNYQVNLYMS